MRRLWMAIVVMMLMVTSATQLQATPPRGLMQARYGGGGDCGCEAHVYEPGCGCETAVCDTCNPCCPRIIPAVVHGAGCLVHGAGRLLGEIFCCHRCYEPCCDTGCEVGCGCEASCGCDYSSGYEGEIVPMTEQTSRAYQNWNLSPKSAAASKRTTNRVSAPRPSLTRSAESSVVKSKPAPSKKPAKISTRTAAAAKPIDARSSEPNIQDEVAVIRRTSYNEPSQPKPVTKAKSRVPHNPLRD